MAQRLRTFIAVELASSVQSKALKLIDQLRLTSADVKWVERENLHLTLQFLGNVTIQDAAEVCLAVTKAVEPLPEFEIEAHGAGAFPSAARPRTIWLGVRSGQEEMIILHDTIQTALEELGYRREARRFTPHVTIGRVHGPHGAAELAELLRQHADFPADRMLVSDVVVFSSQLGRDGPKYEPLGTAELRG